MCKLNDITKTNVTMNYQNNSINGTFEKNNKKFFYKMINCEKFISELNGYFMCNNQIPIMSIESVEKIDDQFIIVYNYNNSVTTNNGTLNDLFVKYDSYSIIDKNKFMPILKIYDKNLYNIKRNVTSKNDIFFKKRVFSRLIKWYNNCDLFNKEIYINDNICNITKIIQNVFEYFNHQRNVECFFTEGDPNTLNIGLDPCFFDLETCGYNSILGELAITIISVLFFDNYYCPKYHNQSYFNHEKIFEIYKKYYPNITYKEYNNKIFLTGEIKSSYIRACYIEEYLKILKKHDIFLNNDLFNYIVMRLLCVFDIRNMEKIDSYYIIYLINYFNQILKDDVIENLLKMVSKLKEDSYECK